MTDPLTQKLVDHGAKSLGAVVDKLLGPTAEVMGHELVDWYTRKRNIAKVAERAAERSNLERAGAIPARVAAEVFDKAQWADDEFVAEYLSGVLASARTTDGLNDSGVSWTALVGRLSADQLALHWSIYTGVQRRHRGGDSEQFWTMIRKQVVVDYPTLFSTLGWPIDDDATAMHRVMDAAYGLRREGLLNDLTHGPGDYLQNEISWTKGHRFDSDRGYLTFKVTADGVGLLLHAIGEGKRWFGTVVTHEVSLAVDASATLPSAAPALLVEDLPPVAASA
ncbi:hypothetical protein [Microbacterium sp. 2FI]|uniref:hypothetical protein n=1 Tax=Microbacterium sp. 2FI TaxID=2502193 RepID=UPI0010F9BBA8|nr:hypothetical protein [Microbacterium sp. 2FI]